jgi:hypothetical protein
MTERAPGRAEGERRSEGIDASNLRLDAESRQQAGGPWRFFRLVAYLEASRVVYRAGFELCESVGIFLKSSSLRSGLPLGGETITARSNWGV